VSTIGAGLASTFGSLWLFMALYGFLWLLQLEEAKNQIP
jgi:hypothetical protein